MITMENLQKQKVLVLGLAKSGTAAAKLLLANGVNVRINDGSKNIPPEQIDSFQKMGADVIVGAHPLSVLDRIDLIVKNPGIPYTHPLVVAAEARNIPIITEVELASSIVPAENMIAVTGSNGKTTTTTLIVEMLTSSGIKAQVSGNIGSVATEVAQNLEQDEKMVIECSSFQLLGVETFKPKVAVLLNIYEAHLDYHQTFSNYQQAKWNIFKQQTEEDFLVYNDDDPLVKAAIHQAKSNVVPFSTTKKLPKGAWSDDTSLYYQNEAIIDIQSMPLVGSHNIDNALAAIAVAKLNGATNEGIREVLQSFSGVKHRLQFVDNINGRLFYNDSKATNVLATEKALSAFQNKSIILLAGGLDRGNDFEALIPLLKHVKGLIVFGETAEKLRIVGRKANIEHVVAVESMQEAVQAAYEISEEKDIILLSPACASWDQYETFEERGDMFIQAVHTLV